ncbi:MAG TPA: tail fiber protein [Phycisphaerae bacterium]|nr:tail fiber protein [Phycisphaerae bacterium]
MKPGTPIRIVLLLALCSAAFAFANLPLRIDDGRGVVKSLQLLSNQALIVGEVRLWAGSSNKLPTGWRVCDGTPLSPKAYPELFSVIQHNYGGEGDRFKLPDFCNKLPVGADAEKGYPLTSIEDPKGNMRKQSGGRATVRLGERHLPRHSHDVQGVISHNGCQPRNDRHNAMNGMGCWEVNFPGRTSESGDGDELGIINPYCATTFIIYTGRTSE